MTAFLGPPATAAGYFSLFGLFKSTEVPARFCSAGVEFDGDYAAAQFNCLTTPSPRLDGWTATAGPPRSVSTTRMLRAVEPFGTPLQFGRGLEYAVTSTQQELHDTSPDDLTLGTGGRAPSAFAVVTGDLRNAPTRVAVVMDNGVATDRGVAVVVEGVTGPATGPGLPDSAGAGLAGFAIAGAHKLPANEVMVVNHGMQWWYQDTSAGAPVALSSVAWGNLAPPAAGVGWNRPMELILEPATGTPVLMATAEWNCSAGSFKPVIIANPGTVQGELHVGGNCLPATGPFAWKATPFADVAGEHVAFALFSFAGGSALFRIHGAATLNVDEPLLLPWTEPVAVGWFQSDRALVCQLVSDPAAHHDTVNCFEVH
ncbi:MAG: hypothetical protein HY904_04175 [Deltaproteobacteria bacterium]|nr:hypothetical protein [Deltaproteobacteria bacterium]